MAMLSYLATKYAELQGEAPPVIAGVGLVLDTRANAAAAVLRRLEGEARLLEEDTGGPEEMSDLSGGAKSPLQVLKGQIAIARVDAAAAREDDGVVVERKHLEGAAHTSGRVENGDMVVAVNGTPVGVDLELAGRLIRGPAGTTVSLALRKVACAGVQGAQGAQGARVEVELERRLLPDHPMGPQQASSLW